MNEKIFLNGKVKFTFKVVTPTGSIVNVDSLNLLSIVFKKPDDSILEVTPTLVTDGSDGLLSYTTTATDLDQVGTWRVQLITDIDPGNSYIERFRVRENLKPIPTN